MNCNIISKCSIEFVNLYQFSYELLYISIKYRLYLHLVTRVSHFFPLGLYSS
nr:MAG TPA: hypothetical protein [Caudoviricetes sp.]